MDPGTIAVIISAPGQLVKAAVSLKKLYDAFFDEHQNSTVEARDFAQLVSTFAINLINQERLISRAGKFFPGEENFLKTIDQCERYLKGYDSLLKEKAKPVRKAYETAKWSADLAQDRKMLMDKLNIHVNSMNAFSMNVLLEIALHDREAIRTTSSNTADIPVAEEDQTLQKFRRLYNSLYDSIVVLQNRQKRDKRYERKPDLVRADLEKIIEQWREIMIESGMVEGALPKIPDSSEQDTLNSIMQRWRRGTFLEQKIGAQSLHIRSPPGSEHAGELTPRSILESAADSTPTSRRSSAVSDTGSRRTSIASQAGTAASRRQSLQSPRASFPKPSPHPEHDMHHSPIDDMFAAQYESQQEYSPSIASTNPPSVFDKSPTPTWHTNFTGDSLVSQRKTSRDLVDDFRRLSVTNSQPIAELKWDHRKVPLYTYQLEDTKKSRILTWNKDTDHEVEHVLAKSVHPFTKHQGIGPPLDVSFLEEEHEVIYRKKTFKVTPTYIFNDPTECKKFQSLVHGRQLLEVFDVETITTATSSKQGEATDQHVKIWKSRTADRYYLTYYANALAPQKHRALLVSWFDRPSLADSAKGKPTSSIRLSISKAPRPRAPSGPSRRRSGLSITSFARRDSLSSSSAAPAATATGLESRRTSVVAEGDDPACPEAIAKLEYLQIEFAKPQARNEFASAFTKASDGTLGIAATSPSIPEMDFEGRAGEGHGSLLDLGAESEARFAQRRATPASLLGMEHLVGR